MFKTRLISGFIGLLLLGIIVYSGKIALSIGVFIVSLIGVYEFYNAVSNVGYKPVRMIGYISCVPVILIGLNGGNESIRDYLVLIRSANYIFLALFLVVIALMCMIIFFSEKYNIIDISLTVFGALYVPFLFYFIVLTRNLDYGIYYLWLIFIGAFATDTFAYLSGKFFGKVKLLPVISPKKTIEGSVGGILGCMILTYIYGFFINFMLVRDGSAGIPFYHFIILGAVNGVISQVGDWAASAIKRFSKIKDYGALIPGHGGVLDRFDSILFVAPSVFLYLCLIVF